MTTEATAPAPTLLGHPTGLYTLFFAEMWERFSFYGMRALLVLYMTKGFLDYADGDAYAVYGAYGALVYATPFLGGMFADRLLGARRAVVLGGLFMAAGHLLMGVEHTLAFYLALALLIVGNGFFKPNISTIVGRLYDGTDLNRAGGFTIFYMGINLGAAAASLLCGYLGETYGWHYGFGLATIGMLIGIAIFVVPTNLSRFAVLTGALATGGGMFAVAAQQGVVKLFVNGFVGLAMVTAGVIAFVAMGRGGLPAHIGDAPSEEALAAKTAGLRRDVLVYVGALLSVPLFALLVSRHELATGLLSVGGLAALTYIVVSAVRSEREERDRLFVVLVLMFFSMLFWAFFEQAGSSMTSFTDRNVDRVFASEVVTADMVGQQVQVRVSQQMVGRTLNGEALTLTAVDALRGQETVQWTVSEADVGMALQGEEIAASEYQSANPIFILLFGPVFSFLWGWLGKRGWEPSTPTKFALGLLQLGLGFGALWYGVTVADDRGMVAMSWLLLGYLLHTTGEICLSPVGLGMVTRLSPRRMVSTVMGAWFLATAFSHLLAGLIAVLTAVPEGAEETGAIPLPLVTVDIYGDVFGQIAIVAIGAALLCFALVPALKYGMHGES